MTLPSKLPPPPSLFSASSVMAPSIKLYVVPQKSHASRGDVGMATSCGRGSRILALGRGALQQPQLAEKAKTRVPNLPTHIAPFGLVFESVIDFKFVSKRTIFRSSAGKDSTLLGSFFQFPCNPEVALLTPSLFWLSH